MQNELDLVRGDATVHDDPYCGMSKEEFKRIVDSVLENAWLNLKEKFANGKVIFGHGE